MVQFLIAYRNRERKQERTPETIRETKMPLEEYPVRQSTSHQDGVSSNSPIGERVLRILILLKTKGADGLTGSILSFRALDGKTFNVETNFANSKTSLRYDTSGKDEVLRI